MFRLICLTTGEPVNDVVYTSAEEALNAKHSLGVKARIQRVITNEWAVREHTRLSDGTYTPVPEFLSPFMVTRHYVHVSSTDRTRLAYTQSPEKGMEDRQTVTTVGAYLGKYAADKLQPHQIRDLADRYAAWAIGDVSTVISYTREAFRFAYSNQPVYSPSSSYVSCMAKAGRTYTGNDNLHPAEAYSTDSDGLHIAYTVKHDDPKVVTARAVIWPKHNHYIRIYALDDAYRTALDEYLKANDYTRTTDFEGAPLSRIEVCSGDLSDEEDGEFLMPYIDGEAQCVSDFPERKRFIICDNGCGDYGAHETSGVLATGDASSKTRCACCGERGDAGYMNIVDGERWCEDCISESAAYCENHEEYFSVHNTTFNTVYAFMGYGRHRRIIEQTWCASACRFSAFECERTGNLYAANDFEAIEVVVDRHGSTETWCQEAAEADDALYYCEHCEKFYANKNDLVARHEDRCQSCLDELVKAEEEAGRIYPIYICDYHQMEMGV